MEYPIISPNCLNISTHAFISLVQLLQCTIATAAPSGVVTISICSYTFDKGFSSTTIAKTLVPADVLPVRRPTELVATIPVPASPSGGHTGIPASSFPDTSRSFAPSAVRLPASSPAERDLGRTPRRFQPKPQGAISLSNFATISLS